MPKAKTNQQSLAHISTYLRTLQQEYTANVYTQMTDKLLFLYAINTHENM